MNDVASEVHAEGVVGFLLRMRTNGITEPRLLKALEMVPHEQFVPIEHYERAWQPSCLPIACGQTLHAPDLTARMIHALGPQSHHTVLEIGTGTGFQTGVLGKLAKKVHSLDRYQSLINAAQERLNRLNISNVTFKKADGREGTQGQGLYDGIISDLAFEAQPRNLLDQLVSGGVVVAPIGPKLGEQTMCRLTKIGSRFEKEELFKVRLGTFEAGVSDLL